MTRTRLIACALLLAACRGPAREAAPSAPDGLLVLAGDGTVLTLDAASGQTAWSGPAVTPLGRAEPLFTTTLEGGATLLESRDPAGSDVTMTARIPGAWEIRAVSADGSRVALLPPHPDGVDPWTPVPRARTRLVVTGPGEPKRFDLMGNLEPEAFSFDGATLFLIRHMPAEAPVAYRVAGLDLRTGDVYPLATRNKDLVETMAGTRLSQTASADGRMLYTLYSSQPPAYAQGHDAAQAAAGEHVAFVHTLALDGWWAHCVGLPRELWGGDPAEQAIAVSPSGRSVYVVDVGRGMLVDMDPEELTVSDPVRIDFGPVGDGSARMTVTSGSEILVANGRTLTTIDAVTLEVTGRATLAGPATGIGADPDGRALYITTRDGVQVLDPETAGLIETLPASPGSGPVEVSSLPA